MAGRSVPTTPPYPVPNAAHTDIEMRELYRRLRGIEVRIGGNGTDPDPEPEPSSANIRLATITEAATEPDMVTVQYLDDSTAASVLVWPNTEPGDYASFFGTDIVVPVVTVDEIPYVMQLLRWDIRTPSASDERGECFTG